MALWQHASKTTFIYVKPVGKTVCRLYLQLFLEEDSLSLKKANNAFLFLAKRKQELHGKTDLIAVSMEYYSIDLKKKFTQRTL